MEVSYKYKTKSWKLRVGEMALQLRRPMFDLQHSQDSSQPSVTPIPRELMMSSDFCRNYTDIHADKSPIYIN